MVSEPLENQDTTAMIVLPVVVSEAKVALGVVDAVRAAMAGD